MGIVVEGRLKQPAESRSRLSAEGTTAVIDLVVDAGVGFPWEVRIPFGQDFTTAERLAASWRTGTPIEIRCTGARPKIDHGIASILAINVDTVHVAGVPYAGARA